MEKQTQFEAGNGFGGAKEEASSEDHGGVHLRLLCRFKFMEPDCVRTSS